MGNHAGKSCGDRLTIQLLEGQELSQRDVDIVADFFSGDRVYRQGDRAVVWLAYWTPLTMKPRTMRVVYYESLRVDEPDDELEATALKLGRKILDLDDVEVSYTRAPNGEAWLTVDCDFDRFATRMMTR